ncbi:MAG: hypothetical protein NVSMB68_02460 [Thermoanaerobaculia bacterium]
MWIRPQLQNAERVLKALTAFGAPVGQLRAEDFASPGTAFHIGIDPLRIDILSSIDGLTFDEAWRNRIAAMFDDEGVSVLSKDDLIRNKKASGRTQDLADIEALQRLR